MHAPFGANVSASPDKSLLPPGLNNAFLFAGFNALSFPIVVGSPMVLYAKTLGASATVLGLIVGMMPLLVIFQIPAARHVTRVGYKRFVYAGWGTRTLFIFGMALVPATGKFLDKTTQLVLLLALLFAFNLSRGISSAAWLPWITSLVPAEVRGWYLSRDAFCVNLASFIVILISAGALGGEPTWWHFSLLFVFSSLMGATSLIFLKRIPEVSAPEEAKASAEPVPWREIASFPPFRKLMWFNVGWAVTYGGANAFTVAWLRAEAGMSEGRVLLITSAAFLGGLSSLWILGSRMDRLGSKPVLTASLLLWLVVAMGWVTLAGKAATPGTPILLTLQFFMGLCAAMTGMANTRLAMLIIPPMGRSHFFALFSVVANLTLGIAPVLWGLFIDLLAGTRLQAIGLEWNRYAFFFSGVALVCVAALALIQRLEEPAAASVETLLRDVLVEAPQRLWVRYWPK